MKELELEQKKLKEIKEKINSEIDKSTKYSDQLNNKIANLKKESKGTYHNELEITKKVQDINGRNFKNYMEILDKPYFARVDFREYRHDIEPFYLGKFGVDNRDNGEEIVIDWRAPIADLYYSGTEGEAFYKSPVGVVQGELYLKRKFLFNENNDIEKIFDEGINEIILKSGIGENALVDDFLKISLEKESTSKLKEVIATIQKEQNDIIRESKNQVIIVQGSAGSGKTTVALHRLAYLLYRHNEKLKADKVGIVAPNKVFLDYISDVLPDLGNEEVKQFTFEEFAMKNLGIKGKKLVTKDKKLIDIIEKNSFDKESLWISKFKGSIEFRTIIDNFIKLLEKNDLIEGGIKSQGIILFSYEEISALFLKGMVNIPISKRKEEIKRYFLLKLKTRISDAIYRFEKVYDEKILNIKITEEENEERRKKIIALYGERDHIKNNFLENAKKDFTAYFFKWMSTDFQDLYYKMFENEDEFMKFCQNTVTKDQYELLKQTIKENIDKNLIDADDLAAMLYLKFKTDGMKEDEKFQYLIVDEAQDYSYLHFELFKKMTIGSAMTLLGDIGQGIYSHRSINDWGMLQKNVFPESKYMILTRSYRSTIEIIKFANLVLKKQKNYLDPAIPVLRHGDEPTIFEYTNNKSFTEKLIEIYNYIHKKGKKKIAIVVKDIEEGKKIYIYLKKHFDKNWKLIKDTDTTFESENIIITSYMTKGLEFDCVVIYNASKEIYKDNNLDKKLLYVVLTRSLHYEYIGYSGEISTLLT